MTNLFVAPAPAKRTYEFIYDFATLGGAQATIPMTAVNGAIPAKFIVQNAALDIITGFTGVTCTGAISIESAGDLVVATIVAGAPFSTTGPKVTLALMGTIGQWVKTTVARTPTITFALANATAGRCHLFCEGFQSE